jgi:hypothetical protein
MRTRTKVANKIDIKTLPKEILFELLLKIEPHEISIVCRSKNSSIRAICSSKLFQETYKKKYPKKLMIGKIKHVYDYQKHTYIFTDETGNKIKILYENDVIEGIEYIPFKQVYPSTYIKSEKDFVLTEDMLRERNPLIIDFYNNDDGEYVIEFGRREPPYGIFTRKDDENFIASFNPEIKEFLLSIEKPNWYDEKYKQRNAFGSNIVKKEFYNEIVNTLNTVWQIINPLNL